MSKSYDYLFKVLFIGDSDAYKTGLIFKLADEDLTNSEFISTIGIDFKIRHLEVDDKMIKTQLWDTAGQERFITAINTSYYRGTSGIFLVYDVCNELTFHNIEKWIENIKQHTEPNSVDVIILGNNCHRQEERQISIQQGQQLASQHGMKFFETSVENNVNVEEAFLTIIKDIKARQVDAKQSVSSPTEEALDGTTTHTEKHGKKCLLQ